MRLKIATLVLSPLFFSCDIHAIEPAGKTMIAKGNVSAYDDIANSRKLRRRAPVYGVDTVETSDKSKAQLRMNDGTLLALKENSKLLISEYNYNAEEGGGSAVLELVEGGLRSVTGAIKSNNGSYQLKTPVGSIGIRGTHYEIEIIQGEVFIAVWDGAVDVNVEVEGTGQEVSLGEGEDYAYAKIDETGEVTELLEPPENFNEGHSSDPATDEEQPADEQGGDEQGGDEQGGDEQSGDEQGGDEQGGDEQGGDGQGGDEQSGDEQGGDGQGGDEQGGDGQGGDEQSGDEQSGDGQGGDGQGGNEQGGNEQGGNEQGGNEQGGDEQSGGNEGDASSGDGSSGGSSSTDTSSGDSSSSTTSSGESSSSTASSGNASSTGTSSTGTSSTGTTSTDTSSTSTSTNTNTGSTTGTGTSANTPSTDTTSIDTGSTPSPNLDTTSSTTNTDLGTVESPIDEGSEQQRDEEIIRTFNNNTKVAPEIIAARTGTANFSRLISSNLSGSQNPRNLNVNISVNFDTTFSEGNLSLNDDGGNWTAGFQGLIRISDSDLELYVTSVTYGLEGVANSVQNGSGSISAFFANQGDVLNGNFNLSQGVNNVNGRFVLGEN